MADLPFTGMSRRMALAGLGAVSASLLSSRAFAQAPGRPDTPPPSEEAIANALPLDTTGLEHLAMIVPDVTVSARFYSKLFNPDGLHKEQEGNLRYYVSLDPDAANMQPVGYLAIGARDVPPPAFMDHFCPLVRNYDAAAMAARAEREGMAPGNFGLMPDPDGIGLQLLGVPAGLAASTEPATRIVNGDALARPRGLDYVLLLVSDLDASIAHYRKFFGPETARDDAGARFDLAGTFLILEQRTGLGPARLDRFGVRVEPFDRAAVADGIQLAGGVPEDGEGPQLRLRDPYGLGCALVPVQA